MIAPLITAHNNLTNRAGLLSYHSNVNLSDLQLVCLLVSVLLCLFVSVLLCLLVSVLLCLLVSVLLCLLLLARKLDPGDHECYPM